MTATFDINSTQPGGMAPPSGYLANEIQWTATPKHDDNPVRQSFNDIKAANDALGEFVEALNTQGKNLTPEGRQAAINGFANTQAAGLVDIAQTRMDAFEAQAQADYDATLESLSPKGDAATELRNQRTLHSAERTLSNIDPGAAAATATKLVREADPEARGLLLQELPSILEGRGIPGGDVVEKAAVAVAPELAGEADTVRSNKKK